METSTITKRRCFTANPIHLQVFPCFPFFVTLNISPYSNLIPVEIFQDSQYRRRCGIAGDEVWKSHKEEALKAIRQPAPQRRFHAD